jgi:hypothetical protein
VFTYFPAIYPGETLNSLIARYHSCSINNSLKDTIEDIFGTRSISVSAEFPNHLEALEKRIDSKLVTKEKLIEEHTLYSIYEPFLFEDEQSALREKMYSDGGLGIKGQIGFLAGTILKKEHFYFCPICMKEDIEIHGESYFRVVHQFQGNFVCAKHDVILEKYPISQKDVGRVTYVRLDEAVLFNLEIKKNTNPHLKSMSEMIELIHGGYLKNFNAEALKKVYIRKLKEDYILTPDNDGIRYSVLTPALNDYYGVEFLESMDSSIERDFQSSWIRKLLRTKRVKVHPIRHLLFIKFLFGNLENFIRYAYQPEAIQKYPCLNKVCKYYQREIVTDLVITADYKTREPVGTFKCHECGYIYSRKMTGDPYKIGRVKDFGNTFIQEVGRVSRLSTMSLREKARHMGCDTGTIKKFEQKMTAE